MPTIRKFNNTPADYQGIADLLEAITGNSHHRPENLHHMDQIRGAEKPVARFIVEADEKIVALGAFGQDLWFNHADKLHLDLAVHPDFKNRGIAEELYARLIEETTRYNPSNLAVRVTEDDEESIQFWRPRDFVQVSKEPRCALDLKKFDPSKFKLSVPEGISISTLAELQSTDSEWLRKWWHMESLILDDMATPEEPAELRTFAQFEQDIQHPAIIPEAFFFAVDGNQFVAISGLTRYDEVTFMADLTWAIPSHQNLGIELALKLTMLRWAKDNGATHIIDEAREDDPTYQINLNLGFEHLPAWLVLEKGIIPT